MKKLLQINVTANWGSTGKIAEQIGLCAMSQGWESYIAYGRMMNPSKSKLIKIGSQQDVYEHYVEGKIFDKEGLASRRATGKFIKLIDEIQPDIIQLHNIHDHFFNYRMFFEYLNQTNIKVVWTFHDCWAFTGHCCHFVQENCMKWQSECHDCTQRNRFVDRSYENFLLKRSLFSSCNSLTIVPCSDWMANFVKHSFLKNKRINVIHNGIDLDIFNPSSIENTSKTFDVLAVSNVWNKDKGVDDILALRNLLPDDYTITIVGLNEKQLRMLPLNIRGIQRTQNMKELVNLYSEADVLINPTYADTFPTVNLEALACGTPVITYCTGGSPEAIDELTGLVVAQGDVNALANAVVCMKGHPLSPSECRKRAEKYFDKDKCFEKYIELYESLL